MTNRETLTGDGPGSLSYALDFDHVLLIAENGDLLDPATPIYAPECYDPAPEATLCEGGWTLITSGLTGQYDYSGPWLHDSEQIEGGVARHILAHAAENGGGYYVAVYATYDDRYGEIVSEGWAIAYRPAN